ncbi:MAG: DUF4240 domain-containing protein [Bacteroidota bacterium]
MEKFNPEEISDNFWEIVSTAKPDDISEIENNLKEMDCEALVHFFWSYEFFTVELKSERCVQAVWSVTSHLSEDSLDDLCQWIVEQGKDFYFRFKSDPYSMLNHIEHSNNADSGIMSAALGEYYDRYDEEMPDWE